ncbi:hypothetical protein [Cryptosporangium sp. NPDC051539]|uniref:hypothetical protein n=1 Tax=Cryptosporangium sp. NPDC051539 TaxID=3363962 RepID=UPI0037A62DD7
MVKPVEDQVVVTGASSVGSIRAVPLQAPYSASKFALLAFYDALRIERAKSVCRSR